MFMIRKSKVSIIVLALTCAWVLSGCELMSIAQEASSSLLDDKNENFILAEDYMAAGDFDKALECYLTAQAESSDPSYLDATIQLLEDFQTAQDYVDNGQYTESVAALKQLQNRVTDPSSALYAAVEDLLNQAQSAQSDSEFAADLERAQEYLANSQYDQCAAMLDTLDADDTLTGDQKLQVADLREELTKTQVSARHQEGNQQQSEQKQSFSNRINELEQTDLKISSAANAEDELALTASSFEQWDALLMEMYDYLSTILNADQYAAEEASFQQWVEERNTAAVDAANSTSDNISNQTASYSLRQSYTKIRCYHLLDMM